MNRRNTGKKRGGTDKKSVLFVVLTNTLNISAPHNPDMNNNNSIFEKKKKIREDTEQISVSDWDDDDDSQTQSSAGSGYSYQTQPKQNFFDKKGKDGNPFQARHREKLKRKQSREAKKYRLRHITKSRSRERCPAKLVAVNNHNDLNLSNDATMYLTGELLNAVMSEDAMLFTADIKDLYLGTPLDRPEYIIIYGLPQDANYRKAD